MHDKINAVIEKAKNDAGFSDKLKEMATKAASTQFGSKEWDDYLSLFAMGPQDLNRMKGIKSYGQQDEGNPNTTWTTTTTVATTTTAACTGTTTTTTTATTSNVCP